jgi:glycosyltransferase involved in cell wall biosynthesis
MIESVLSQSLRSGWELIIVDDGSSDSTGAVAKAAAVHSTQIRVLSQRNAGRGAALNLALSHAGGHWVLPLDADDLLEPHALEHQFGFMCEHPGYQLYSWGFSYLRADGSTERLSHPVTDVVHEVTLESAVRNDAPRMIGTMFIERELLDRVGGYRVLYVEDLDLVIRAMASGARWLHNPETLHTYRVSSGSKSRDAERQLQGKIEVYRRLGSELALDLPVAEAVREVRSSLERQLALGAFRAALEQGDWPTARRRLPGAFRYLAAKPHWWLLAPLVYVAPEVLRALLAGRDHPSHGAG